MSTSRYRRCILATCCVPWSENHDFEEVLFRKNVRHLISGGIHDLYIFGTAGEGHAVTESQFDVITSAFLEETQIEGVQTMVGLISPSLPIVIERIGRARDMGARRFQLTLPSWGVLNDAELKTFFRETCARFPDCEFLHYNLMRSGRILTGAEYGALAGEHANLVATKNSTSDEGRLRSLFTDAPQLRHFITELGFPTASRLGDCGFLISFLSTNLFLARDFFRAGCEHDSATLADLSADFEGLISAFKDAVGGTAHMDGAFDKLFCRIHDPEFPLRLLPPYESVSLERFEHYRDLLRARHPRWMP